MDLALVFLLVVLNGVFAMSEMSLISAKKLRLQQMADKGSSGAKAALALQSNPTRMLSSVQVGITCIGLLSGMVGEKALIDPLAQFMVSWGLTESFAKSTSTVLAVMFLAYLSVVFGEIIPKRIGAVLAEKVASILSLPMTWIAIITLPVVFLFTKTSEVVLNFLNLNDAQQQAATNEEIEDLMNEGSKVGNFDNDERQMVSNVLKLDRKRVTSIMTRHTDFVCLDLTDKYEDNLEKIHNSELSKVLVINGDINNIVGYLPVLKILHLLKHTSEVNFSEHTESPVFVPETLMVMQVLRKFRESQKSFGIVVDEHGENIGLVTASDIFSSMIGEITPDAPEEQEIKMRGENSWFVDGATTIDDLEDELGLEKLSESSGIYTMAGLVLENAACIPSVGYKCSIFQGNVEVTIEVVDMDGNTIDKLIVEKNQILPEIAVN